MSQSGGGLAFGPRLVPSEIKTEPFCCRQFSSSLPPEVSLRAEDGERVTPRGLGLQPEAAAEPAGVSSFILKFMRILHFVPSVSGLLPHTFPS